MKTRYACSSHDNAFDDQHPKRGGSGLFKYSLDPNAVFDEVVLDPRLTENDAFDLKSKLNRDGCRLSINHSILYQAPHFIIPMN